MGRGVRNINPMIGMKFGVGEHLEVVEWDGTRTPSGMRLYTVKCHVCAKDPELYGDGTFKFRAGCLRKGRIPCGCSTGARWDQVQYKVLLRRAGDAGRFEIIIPEDQFVASDTRLVAECKVCTTRWTALVSCFRGGRGCPKCGSAKAKAHHRKPDKELTDGFLAKGGFLDGTTFTRVFYENAKGNECSRWQIYCPKCSNDEYVLAGLCTGDFISSGSNISAGKQPCRCVHRFKWTREQREYQIHKACTGQPFSFVAWVDDKKFGAFDKFRARCNDHGEWLACPDKFVNSGQRCPSCAKGGFSTQEEGSVYVLKIVGESTSFVGYGISNVLNSRLSTHKRNLALKGFKIAESFTADMQGKFAWDIEQMLKKQFPCNPQNVEGFKTEATYAEHYQDVIDFVDQWLFNNT